jgi:hypothetical protein
MQMNTYRKPIFRKSLVFFVMLCALVGAGACRPVMPVQTVVATSSSSAPVTIEINQTGMIVPATMPTGIVAVTIKNSTAVPRIPVLARLKEGVSMAAYTQALEKGSDVVLKIAHILTWQAVAPQTSVRIVYDLQPGAYVASDFGGEQPTYIPFQVQAADHSPRVAPQAAVEVKQVDFAFVLPDTVPAGPHLWQLANAGGQWHEMMIVKIHPGKTIDDVIAAMQTENSGAKPPFDMVVAWAPMSEGERAWVNVDLAPGKYTVLCSVTDFATMQPHVMKGMVRTLTVK